MNKASRGDGIPAELFQILKDDAVQVLHSICQQIWKAQQWPQDWKMSVFIPMPKKGNAKECSNYCTVALILHSNKVMLKILQARLQQYVNQELPDVQAGLRKGRGTRDQIANIHWIIGKAREFQKNIYFSDVELDHKEGWAPKNWYFWTVVLEKTLESPLDYKIKPVSSKGNQPWMFIGRTDAEAPILWPLDEKNWLLNKDPDAGKDWRQEEKGRTEDERVEWHHRLNGDEFEQAPGVGDGQGSLACCGSWGRKESDATEQVNSNSPPQHSCLENSMDRGAWWARVHGVAKGWTQLSNHFHYKGCWWASWCSLNKITDQVSGVVSVLSFWLWSSYFGYVRECPQIHSEISQAEGHHVCILPSFSPSLNYFKSKMFKREPFLHSQTYHLS